MNKIYHIIWSHATQSWVVVSELTKAHKKKASRHSASFKSAVENAVKYTSLAVLLGASLSEAYAATAYPNTGANKATAGQAGATAYGSGASAGYGATALGENAKATATGAVAVGAGVDDAAAQATDKYATAIGEKSRAGGEVSTAIGSATSASGIGSVAIGAGYAQKNTKDGEIKGYAARALENYAIAIGSGSNAKQDSVALGRKATTDGLAAIAIGKEAEAGTVNARNENGSYTKLSEDEASIAIGTKAKAKVGNAVAVGTGAQAVGGYSVVMGVNAIAGNKTVMNNGALVETAGQVAIGQGANALGFYSTVIGHTAEATNVNGFATAIGKRAKVEGIAGTALGVYAFAKGDSSIAIGGPSSDGSSVDTNGLTTNARALGKESIAIGKNTEAAEHGISMGSDANTQGSRNIAIGKSASVSGANGTGEQVGSNELTDSIAIGNTAKASAKNAIVIGNGAKSIRANKSYQTGQDTIAVGSNADASFTYSIAMGTDANAGMTESVAIGYKATTNETGRGNSRASTAIGTKTKATGANSTAVGISTEAIGENSSAFGVNAKAQGSNSVAIGNNAQALSGGAQYTLNGKQYGNNSANSVVIGDGALTRQNRTISLGYNAQTLFTSAMALGDSAYADAARSIAIGRSAQSTGENAIALGSSDQNGTAATQTTASGSNSIAVGSNARASSADSIAIGKNTKATVDGGIALGLASEATTAGGIQGFNPAASRKNDYQNAKTGIAAESTLAAVSIGKDTQTRQITHLAAGTQETDAVNVAQLKAVNLQVKGNTTDSKGADVRLFDQALTVKGADNNFITTNANNNELTISTTRAKTQVNANGQVAINSTNNGPADGLVTAGDIISSMNSMGWNIQTSGENLATGNQTGKSKVSAGTDVSFQANQNLTVKRTNTTIEYALANNLTGINSIQGAGNKIQFTNSGVDLGNQVIRNLTTGGDTDTNAANISDVKRISQANDLRVKSGEYTVNNSGTVELPYQNGSGQEVANAGKVKINGIVTPSLSNITNTGKQTINSLSNEVKAGNNVSIAENKDQTTNKKVYTVSTTKTTVSAADKSAVEITSTYDATKSEQNYALDVKVDNKTIVKDQTDGTLRANQTLNLAGDRSTTGSINLAKDTLSIKGATGEGITGLITTIVDSTTKTVTITPKLGEVRGDSAQWAGKVSAYGDNGLMTSTDVAKAINDAGWIAAAGSKTDGSNTIGTSYREIIKPGDVQYFNAGDNLTITQVSGTRDEKTGERKTSGSFTYALAKDLTGINSITGTGDTKVTFSGTGIDLGNKKITGVAEGTANTDAVNVGQLNAKLAENLSTEKVKAKGGEGNLAKVTPADAKDGYGAKNTEYEVSVDKNDVKDAAREAVTLTQKATGAITVTATPNNTEHTTTYDVSFNGAEAAKAIDLKYKSNNTESTAKSVKLSQGLDFTNGTRTVATVDDNGVVKFDLNADTAKKIDDAIVNNTIKLGAGKAGNIGSTTTEQHLNEPNGIQFNIVSGSDHVTTSATGKNVTVDLSNDTKTIINNAVDKNLTKLTDAGKKVVTDLINIEKGDRVSVTSNTDNTSKVKTFTISADEQVEKVEAASYTNGDENIATVTSADKGKANATYAVGVSKNAVKAAAAWILKDGKDNDKGEEISGGESVVIKNTNDNVVVTRDKNTISVGLGTALTGLTSIGGNNQTITFGNDGISMGNAQVINVASGIGKDTNAANIGDVKTISSQNDVFIKKDTYAVTGNTVELKYQNGKGDDVDGVAKITGIANADDIWKLKVKGGDVVLDADKKVDLLAGDNISIKSEKGKITISSNFNADAASKNDLRLVAHEDNKPYTVDKDGTVTLKVQDGNGNNGYDVKIGGIAKNDLSNITTEGETKIKNLAAWKLQANNGQAETISGNETVTLKNGQNIEISNSGKVFTVKTSDNLIALSLTTGGTVVNGSGVTIGTGANAVSLTANGLNNGGHKITGVAEGEANTDAVNVGQLNAKLAENLSTEKVKAKTGDSNLAKVTPATDAEAYGKKGTEYEVSVDKNDVKDAAREAVTLTENATGPVTVEKVEGDHITTYNVSFNGAEAAKTIDLKYKSNNTESTAKSVKLSQGLDFTNGTRTVATVDDNGVVKFDLNADTAKKIDDAIVNNTIKLGAGKAGNIGSTTTEQHLNEPNGIQFNIVSGSDHVTTSATGKNVTVDLSNDTKAIINNAVDKSLTKLTPEGKKVVTDLIDIKNGDRVSVTSNTDNTSKVKTFTISADEQVEKVEAASYTNSDENIATVTVTKGEEGKANATYAVGVSKKAVREAAAWILKDGKDADGKGETISGGQSVVIKNTNDNVVVSRDGSTINVGLGTQLTGLTSIGGNKQTITFGNDGISMGNAQVTNVASGGDVETNAANIGDVKTISSQNDVFIKKDTYAVTGNTVELKYQNGKGEDVEGTAKITGIASADDIWKLKVTGNDVVLDDNKKVDLLAGDNISIKSEKGKITISSNFNAGAAAKNDLRLVAPEGDKPYTVDDNGTVTLAVRDGEGKNGHDVKISGIAKNDLSNITTVGETKIKNLAAWKLQANDSAAETISGNETVTLKNGQNIEITNSGKVFTVKTSDNLTASSLTTGGTVVNGTGVAIGTGDNAVSLTTSGLNNGGHKITGVAKGEADTDAVNVSQLNAKLAENLSTEKVKAKAGDSNLAKVTPASNVEAYGKKGTEYEVSVDKNDVKDAAREAVTLTENNTGPVTVTKASDDNSHTTTYNVSFNGAKAAESIPLSYAANNDTAKTVTLNQGLKFTNGTHTVASVKDGGVVTFDLSEEMVTTINNKLDKNLTNITEGGKTALGNIIKVAAGTNITSVEKTQDNDKNTVYTVNAANQVESVVKADAETGDENIATVTSADKGKANATYAVGVSKNAVKAAAAWILKDGKDNDEGETISGGESVVIKNADSNVVVTRDKNTISVGLGTALTGLTSIGGNNQTITFETGGINMGDAQITNVAAGKADTDAVNVSQLNKVAAKAATTVTVNDGNTEGNLVLTTDNKTTDGHTNYDVKLADKVTLGTEKNQVTIDGTEGKVTVGGNSGIVIGKQTPNFSGETPKADVEGNYITGLANQTWVVGTTLPVNGRAATEDQLNAVSIYSHKIGSNTISFGGDEKSKTTPQTLNKEGGIHFDVKGSTNITTKAEGSSITIDLSETAKKSLAHTYTVERGSDNVTVAEDKTDTSNTKFKVSVAKTKLESGTNTSVEGDGLKDAFKVNVKGDLTDVTSITNKDGAGKISFAENGVVNVGEGDKAISLDGKTGAVTTGNTVVNQGGLSVGAGESAVKITEDGLNNGGHTITNVAAGKIAKDSTDAVNGGQLHQAITEMKGARTTVTSSDGSISVVDNNKDAADKGHAYNITVNNQAIVEKAQLPVVYTNVKGEKVYKQADGSFNTAKDGKGTRVERKDVIASMNNGEDSTTSTMVLNNVGSAISQKEGTTYIDRLTEANKATPNAAVNVSDLKETTDVLNEKLNGKLTFKAQDGSTVEKKLGETLDVVGENGITTVVAQDKKLVVKLGNTLSVGEKGKDGKDGVDGTIGVNGKDGSSVVINGKDGSIGLTGAPGKDGQSATATIRVVNGKDGANGLDGKSTTRIVYNDDKAIATLDDGMKFAGDQGTTISRKLNSQLNVKGGAKGELTDNNIAVVADGNDTLNVKLARNIDLGDKGSVKTGNTLINNEGVTIGNGEKTVSITQKGINNGGNRITHVGDGKDDSDAVNMGQLKRALINNVNNAQYLNNKIDQVGRNLSAGIAGSVAIGSLYQATAPGKSMVSAGVGTYKGQNAIAVGYSRLSDNGRVGVKLSLSSNSQGDKSAGASVGYQW